MNARFRNAARAGVKRLFDVLFSGAALLFSGPLILLLALLVRWRLGSPVFFTQERPGLGGRAFRLIKFRTMTDARDAAGRLLPDAARLTPLGLFLRRTSLDELPEFWNVLRGDMSIVGPRPLLMRYLPLYTPEQARRHEARPGITGWTAVNGRNSLTWEEKFRHDTWYVEHQSLVLDMKILFLTALKVLRREGISAAGEATMPEFTGCAAGAEAKAAKAEAKERGERREEREIPPVQSSTPAPQSGADIPVCAAPSMQRSEDREVRSERKPAVHDSKTAPAKISHSSLLTAHSLERSGSPPDPAVDPATNASPTKIIPDELPDWVVEEDDDFLVFNKPGNIVCHPSKDGPWSSMIGAAKAWKGVETLHLVSRLDRETSGVLVMAKNLAAARLSQVAMEKRHVAKTYYAVLRGELSAPVQVDEPIQRDLKSEIAVKHIVSRDPAARPSATFFEPLHAANGYTFARVTPFTGRTHQIRVHALWLGHPLAGDKLYGPDERLYLEFVEHGWTPRHAQLLEFSRHALHSARLEFRAPNFQRVFRAPLPPDLHAFCRDTARVPDSLLLAAGEG